MKEIIWREKHREQAYKENIWTELRWNNGRMEELRCEFNILYLSPNIIR
jgi:hypothetical protein